jgi:hypothetical protein
MVTIGGNIVNCWKHGIVPKYSWVHVGARTA